MDAENEVESIFSCHEIQAFDAKRALVSSRYVDQLRLQRVSRFISASDVPGILGPDDSDDMHDASIETTDLAIVANRSLPSCARRRWADIENEQDMARCLHCREWFALKRKDARFCSASCRALYSTARKGEK